LRGMSEPLYQAFVGRAYRLGYTAVEPEDKAQKTEFYKEKQHICDLMPDGEIRFFPGKGVDNDARKLTDLLLGMKPAYSLYADATYLQCDGVKDYKLLCDFGDYLLAAKLGKDNELSFVTWRYEYSHDSVVLGHYRCLSRCWQLLLERERTSNTPQAAKKAETAGATRIICPPPSPCLSTPHRQMC